MPNYPLGGGAGDWFDNYKLEAQKLLKLAPSQLSVTLQDDFFNLDNWSTGDAAVQVTNKQGGVCNGNVGANTTTISDTRVVLSNSPWYQACRFKYSAAVSGDVVGYFGLIQSSVFESYCILGVFSEANVSGGSDTVYCHGIEEDTNITTQTATTITTGYRDFRQWYDGTSLYVAIDNDAPVSIPFSGEIPAGVGWYAAFGVTSSTNGHWDKMLVISGNPT